MENAIAFEFVDKICYLLINRMKVSIWLRCYYSKISSTKMNFYAVAKGRNPGIYETWNECKDQVNKFAGAIYKKFPSISEAQDFIAKHENSDSYYGKKRKNPSSITEYFNEKSRKISAPKCSSGLNYKFSTDTIKEKSILDYFKNQSRTYSSLSSRENASESKYFEHDSEGRVDIYTDGACTDNGKKNPKAGIGVYFGENHPENVSRPVRGRLTNNSAEIEAVIEAAKIARKHNLNKIRINTDSEFLINCKTKWMEKWKAKGWKTAKNQPVINKEELIEMEKALESLDVQFSHVRGHHGIHGNEMADRLARLGAKQSE